MLPEEGVEVGGLAVEDVPVDDVGIGRLIR